ncbi:MAG: hypothetical protein NC213_08035 [Acetobacter sp.]|nr:hypothetical protein [Bacteroides sp.]MCM1341678.1 hypothetical protein [Acetobacter sp.]MCM1434273.1 hypothetical protein [Clostridiales bacterium]
MARAKKRTQLLNAKVSCFAYREDNTCSATTNKNCKKCKFYKTKSEFASEQKKTEKRISDMFKVPYKEFLYIRGLVK